MIATGQVTGTWRNSKKDTKGISEFTLEESNNDLSISIKGDENGFLPERIGPIKAIAHATNETSTVCIAFQASYEADGKSYFFAGNINKGLVIIATYVEVSSEEDSNFFSREFFYKLK